jgi:hypothetical protein
MYCISISNSPCFPSLFVTCLGYVLRYGQMALSSSWYRCFLVFRRPLHTIWVPGTPICSVVVRILPFVPSAHLRPTPHWHHYTTRHHSFKRQPTSPSPPWPPHTPALTYSQQATPVGQGTFSGSPLTLSRRYPRLKALPDSHYHRRTDLT